MNAELLTKAKSLGFSDLQIAHLTGTTEDALRAERKELGPVPSQTHTILLEADTDGDGVRERSLAIIKSSH